MKVVCAEGNGRQDIETFPGLPLFAHKWDVRFQSYSSSPFYRTAERDALETLVDLLSLERAAEDSATHFTDGLHLPSGSYTDIALVHSGPSPRSAANARNC